MWKWKRSNCDDSIRAGRLRQVSALPVDQGCAEKAIKTNGELGEDLKVPETQQNITLMHTGPSDSTRVFTSYVQHNQSARIPLPGGSGPNYASSNHSGRFNSLKKEPVHLPYKSASPDFTDLPQQSYASKGYRPDISYTPRYYGSRSRYRSPGNSMAAFYGAGPDLHIFSTLRSKSISGRQQNGQQLPQLSVVPAPKYNRLHQTTQKRRSPARAATGAVTTPTGAAGSQAAAPKPMVVKRVEVSLHEVQQTPRVVSSNPSASQDGENQPSPTPRLNLKEKMQSAHQHQTVKELTSIALTPVDLNKGLNAASAIRKRNPVTPRERTAPLEKVLAFKETNHVVSLVHLPLKEVYLKPDTIGSKEQASREQQDKTIRILNWLKDLKYLDEKAVQRGRSEVERTQFQLPEIKETALIANT